MALDIYPVMCYGWMDDYGQKMDSNSLKKLSKNIEQKYSFMNPNNPKRRFKLAEYTDQVIDGYKNIAIYGVICDFDAKTGMYMISTTTKIMVKDAYKLWCKQKGLLYCDEELGFYNAVYGDVEWELEQIKTYNLNIK